MSTIQVFEWSAASVSPPIATDDDFLRQSFTHGLRWLQSNGVTVKRHDVKEDVAALHANPTVKSAFEAQGQICLPMVVVDDTIISVGGYPTRTELMDAVAISAGSDPAFLGQLTMEAAALGAALAANAFDRFERHYDRLKLLGVRAEELTHAVQSVAATTASVLQDDMRTRVEQFLAFGPKGKPPKLRCTCADNAGPPVEVT